MGIPAVTICTETFVQLMKAIGKALGVPGLRHAIYPGTIDFDTEDILTEKLEGSLIDEIIDGLTKEVSGSDAANG